MRRTILITAISAAALMGCDDGNDHDASEAYDEAQSEMSSAASTVEARLDELGDRIDRLENDADLDAEAREAIDGAREKMKGLQAKIENGASDAGATMDELADDTAQAFDDLASEVERLENELNS